MLVHDSSPQALQQLANSVVTALASDAIQIHI